MTNTNESSWNGNAARYVLIVLLVFAAFLGMYKFAETKNASAAGAGLVSSSGVLGSANAGAGAAGGSCCGSGAAGAAGGASGAAGGSCCGGGGGSTKKVEATAKLSGGVQKMYVDVKLTYNPNVIHLKAGVPAEITFSQAQGCTGIVQSADLGFQEDLSAGPRTVKLQGLQPGTYGFACGMNMVQGQIVVD